MSGGLDYSDAMNFSPTTYFYKLATVILIVTEIISIQYMLIILTVLMARIIKELVWK